MPGVSSKFHMRTIPIVAGLLLVVGVAAPQDQDKDEGLIVHEWGVTPICRGSNKAKPAKAGGGPPAFVEQWGDLTRKLAPCEDKLKLLEQ